MLLGENIALGAILPTDLPLLYKWCDDAETARFNEPYIPKDWNEQVQFWTNAAREASRLFLAVRKRADNALIGFIQIIAIEPIHRSAAIGIRIGEKAERNHGFGCGALALALDYCWKQLNLTRITLRVFAENAAAIRLYASLGFVCEGMQTKALFIDGGWVDLQLMARLHPSRWQPMLG